ncbi:MAG: cobalt ECF transporter T component CbiQ [Lachnospiraceae bacterium]|nr:cobalt ECF transporter T component CbiQ [Lachnospiraceae bacterium]
MSKISKAIGTIQHIDDLNSRDRWMNRVHPLVKFFIVLFYIAFTMATHKYDINRMILLAIVPFVLFVLADLSVKDTLSRLKIVLPLVFFVGALNIFIEKAPFTIGDIQIRSGFISFATLTLKGIYAVIMSYIFIATTSIEKFCKALRIIKVPKIIVTQIMLTYRYIGLLLEESERVTTAYTLRAPGQKGIHFKVWGTLAGQMLLRTFDRAGEIYDSMKLRGYIDE